MWSEATLQVELKKNFSEQLNKDLPKKNRGFYMWLSAHVLLNLLNELRERDKMPGLLSIISLFRNDFNKYNNTGACLLYDI